LTHDKGEKRVDSNDKNFHKLCVRFADSYRNSLSRWGMIERFRKIASIGIPKAYDDYFSYAKQALKMVKPGAEYEGLLIAPSSLFKEPNLEEFIKEVTQESIKDSMVIIDAISIVYAHSLLDAFLFDLIEIAGEIEPRIILRIRKDKTIKAIELLDNSISDIISTEAKKIIEKWERESIPIKTDLLYMICNPGTDFQTVKDFSFDKKRLEKFDRLRHDIVHGLRTAPCTAEVREELNYLSNLDLHFIAMMNYKFDLKLIFPYEYQREVFKELPKLGDWDALFSLIDKKVKYDARKKHN
jgi:hypothetical protein